MTPPCVCQHVLIKYEKATQNYQKKKQNRKQRRKEPEPKQEQEEITNLNQTKPNSNEMK